MYTTNNNHKTIEETTVNAIAVNHRTGTLTGDIKKALPEIDFSNAHFLIDYYVIIKHAGYTHVIFDGNDPISLAHI